MAVYKIKPHVITVNNGYAYDIYDDKGAVLAKFGTDFLNSNHGELRDLTGHVLAIIQRKMFSLRAEFDITVSGQEMLVVKKDSISPLHPTYVIEGSAVSYQLEGNWRNGDYSIHSNGAVAAQVKVEKTSFLAGDYLVETADGADISTIVCLVMVLDEEQWQAQNF